MDLFNLTSPPGSLDRNDLDASPSSRTPPSALVIPLEVAPGAANSGVKISCLACRLAKRKCITPDAQTICRRCRSQSLTCEYTKHRRGRKRKEVPEGEAEGELRAAVKAKDEGDTSMMDDEGAGADLYEDDGEISHRLGVEERQLETIRPVAVTFSVETDSATKTNVLECDVGHHQPSVHDEASTGSGSWIHPAHPDSSSGINLPSLTNDPAWLSGLALSRNPTSQSSYAPNHTSRHSFGSWSVSDAQQGEPQSAHGEPQQSHLRTNALPGPGPSSMASYADQHGQSQHPYKDNNRTVQAQPPGTLRTQTPEQRQMEALTVAALGPNGQWTGSGGGQVGGLRGEFGGTSSVRAAEQQTRFDHSNGYDPANQLVSTSHDNQIGDGNAPVPSSSSANHQALSSHRPPSNASDQRETGFQADLDGEKDPSVISKSRFNIQFSHVVPDVGDSAPFLPPRSDSRPKDSVPPDRKTSDESARNDQLNPVGAGLLTEADASRLFEFYFRHLNVTVAILDPVLHTAVYCRRKSSLLFTAVLTVTAKIHLPKVYASCLLLANKLCGHAFELGLCSIEIVQALNLLTHWKKSDDATSWRRVGFAIRMAQELRLNVKGARPLPLNQIAAREVLNRERAWLNLIVADFHLSIHHSLPRIIHEEDVDDPTEWITEHPHIACPGETALGPMIQFSRMCRLYADMLAGMSGDPANLRLLHWIELEWKRWRMKWLEGKKYDIVFLPQQLATLKLCDGLFRFHICEYRLLFIARYRSQGQMLDTREPTPLSYAFSECCDACLALATLFQTEFVELQCLPYCFNLVWVALAITSVWLIKNIGVMDATDRGRVIRTLSDVQYSTEQASCSSDDMAAYTTRLLKHLLNDLNPDWHLKSLVGERSLAANPQGFSFSRPMSPSNMASASQMIQEYLWQHPQPTAAEGMGPHYMAGMGANAGYDVNTMLEGMPQQHGQDGFMTENGGVANGHATAGNGQMHGANHELLFPADDDVFWKMLFPIAE